jgi:hypothetical protein
MGRKAWNTGRSAADAEVASPCSHLASPEIQKLIDGSRASAGRNKIKQHKCVHHFRLVKPIVDTICRVNRFVARNHRWRVRQEGCRTNDQKPRAASGMRNPTGTPRPPKNSIPGTNHCNMPTWDARPQTSLHKRLYKCLMSFLIRELMNSG